MKCIQKNVHESTEANVNPFSQPPTFLCVLVTNLLLQILRPLILISKECLDPIFYSAEIIMAKYGLRDSGAENSWTFGSDTKSYQDRFVRKKL